MNRWHGPLRPEDVGILDAPSPARDPQSAAGLKSRPALPMIRLQNPICNESWPIYPQSTELHTGYLRLKPNSSVRVKQTQPGSDKPVFSLNGWEWRQKSQHVLFEHRNPAPETASPKGRTHQYHRVTLSHQHVR